MRLPLSMLLALCLSVSLFAEEASRDARILMNRIPDTGEIRKTSKQLLQALTDEESKHVEAYLLGLYEANLKAFSIDAGKSLTYSPLAAKLLEQGKDLSGYVMLPQTGTIARWDREALKARVNEIDATLTEVDALIALDRTRSTELEGNVEEKKKSVDQFLLNLERDVNKAKDKLGEKAGELKGDINRELEKAGIKIKF